MKNFTKINLAFMAKKKHFALLCALLCASMMGWADPVTYCDYPTGHQKNANYDDVNGRILLTIQRGEGNNIVVTVKNNNANGNTKTGLNYLWVNATDATNNNATYGSHSTENTTEVSVVVEFSASKESYTFNNIHWAYAGWDGEWAIDGLTVSASELCTSGTKPSPELSLNKSSVMLSMSSLNPFQISATREGDGDISYQSNDEGVVTVTDAGLVEVVGAGSTTITVGVAETEDYAYDSKTLNVTVVDWNSVGWQGNGTGIGAYTDVFKVAAASGQTLVNLQSPGWASSAGVYTEFPADPTACSLGAGNYAVQGHGICLYLSNFIREETEVTVTAGGVDYTFLVYNKNGEPEDLTGWNIAKGKTSVAGAYPNGFEPSKANDGVINADRWASGGGAQHYATVGNAAQDWWYVDLGGFYEINQIKILFERANPWDYDLLISNNAASWTVIGTYNTESKYGNNTATDYNEYNFTDKVGRYVKIFARNGYNSLEYGISMFEFEVYGERATIVDNNPPTLTTATLSSTTYNTALITVAGSDAEDGVVNTFHVVDASKSIDQACVASEGIITVTGLAAETTYNFSVTALDAAGNESSAIVVAATTGQDTTIPSVTAPTPSGTNKDVVHIYSDAFPSTDGHSSCLAHDFKKDGFGGVALMQEKNISGDKCLIYNISGAAEVTCGHYDGGSNAIIAAAGYHHESYTGIDATEMEYLHIDIWSLQACSNINIQLNDVSPNTKRSHDGNGWNSYDIPLTDYTFGNTEHTRRANVRFMKINGLNSITGKMALDNIYFWKASSGMQSVSATPNNGEWGTATVKQNGNPVSEVATDSEVTFSAVANEGYIFVNWSNGETDATFNATVDDNMHLTANFRALGTTYCNTLVHSSNGGQEHDAYVTMKRTAENTYQLVVRAEYELGNFSNTEFRIKAVNAEETSNYNLNNHGVLTNGNHVLTGTITSTIEPVMISSKLYVNIVGKYEGQFDQLTNIEYSQPCSDAVAESISLNMSEATIEIGATKTLTVSFNPVYTVDQSITWSTTNGSVASVENGVVTANAIGTATITATTANSKTATCAVTVEGITAKTCWGEGNDFTYQDNTVSYDYSITRNADKTLTYTAEFSRDVTGLEIRVNVHNGPLYNDMSYDSGSKTASFTTTETFETDDYLHGFFYFGGNRTDYYYTVGSVCAKPGVDVTGVEINHSTAALLVGETTTLVASVTPANADDKEIIWENSDPSVATFNSETGVVTAVAEGTTTITAKSHFDQSISASCEVTVTASLTPVTWYGTATFSVAGNPVGFNYSVTRGSDRKLTYHISQSEAVDGMVWEANDEGAFNDMGYNASTRTAEWTTGSKYNDGDNHNFFFYPKFTDGAQQVDVAYVVGSSNAEPNTLLAFGDAQSNTTKITAHVDETLDVQINRTILADNTWYTLCLPFDMSAEKVSEVFGASTIATLESSEDRGSLIHLNFDYVDAIQAGKPYLIKPGTSFTSGSTISGVQIKNVNPSEAPQKAEAEHMHFQGTFNKIMLTGEDKRYVSANNELYSPNPNGGSAIGAFRCYFTIPSGSSASAPGKQARIVFGPQNATGIDLINDSSKANGKLLINGVLYIIRDGNTYNAQGMLVK